MLPEKFKLLFSQMSIVARETYISVVSCTIIPNLPTSPLIYSKTTKQFYLQYLNINNAKVKCYFKPVLFLSCSRKKEPIIFQQDYKKKVTENHLCKKHSTTCKLKEANENVPYCKFLVVRYHNYMCVCLSCVKREKKMLHPQILK